MGDPPAPAPVPAPVPAPASHEEREQNILKSLATLFEKFNGDLDRIFESLREPFPAAWRADPPRDATSFSHRYYYGRDDDDAAADGGGGTTKGK